MTERRVATHFTVDIKCNRQGVVVSQYIKQTFTAVFLANVVMGLIPVTTKQRRAKQGWREISFGGRKCDLLLAKEKEGKQMHKCLSG